MERTTVKRFSKVVQPEQSSSSVKPLKLLNFDLEARPLNFIGPDYVGSEVTSIASCWIEGGKPVDIDVQVLTLDEGSTVKMLKAFRERYDQADIVIGHNIRSYDLPSLNAAYIEFGLAPLGPKMTQDTLRDLVRTKGWSRSQENMSAMFDLKAPKVSMNGPAWREANRLTEKGIALTRERVIGDIIQNVEFRSNLIERGMLKAPKIWRP